MRLFIFLLVLLFLQGCNLVHTEPSISGGHHTEAELLYRFGDPVYVANGFFKGCKGHITDYEFKIHDFSAPTDTFYVVDATCYSVDGRYDAKKLLTIFSGDLLEDGTPR
jgi:hypothetical protein